MKANRPKAAPLLHRPPKLLRNPRQPTSPKWPHGKTIGNQHNAFPVENAQSHRVKPMPRRDPNSRCQPMFAKNRQPPRNPITLPVVRYPRKLGAAMQRHQASPFAIAQVLKTMQSNRRPPRLQSEHLIPELRIRRINLKLRIAIVRHHRQNRLDPESLDQRRKPTPARAIHPRAKIVKAQQVLCLQAAAAPSTLVVPASPSPGGGSNRYVQ